jgi:hypothetical protein
MRLKISRSQKEECLIALQRIFEANKDERGQLRPGVCSGVETEFADWLAGQQYHIDYLDLARAIIAPHVEARKKLWRPRQLALDFAPSALLSLDIKDAILVEAKDADADQLRAHEAVLDEVHRRSVDAYQKDKAALTELHPKFRSRREKLLTVMIRDYGWTPPEYLERTGDV